MKILIMSLILFSSLAQAAEVLVPVESKTGNKYYLQILVPGTPSSQESKIAEIIQSVVPQVTKEFSTNWLLSHREVLMTRLESEFKKYNLACDGVGVLRLRMNGNKILDVE